MGAQELYLFRSPGAWKEVPIVIAMQGDVEHRGVIVKRLLGSIAVVNVLVGRGGSIRKMAQALAQRSKSTRPVVNPEGAARH